MDDGTETHVMKILLSDLPDALSIDHIKEGVAMDPTYQKLVTAIRHGRRDQDPDLRPYRVLQWGQGPPASEILQTGGDQTQTQ